MSQLPPDSNIDMSTVYANHEQRLNTVIGGDGRELAQRLFGAKDEWSVIPEPKPVFPEWLEQRYGVRLQVEQGNYKLEYLVVDQQLYTLFLLKF